MLDKVKIIFNKVGIDKAIAFTILSKIIQALGGLISLVLITRFLTLTEQGFFFTFGSILAIQIFFELGLSGIITQFVAHENAKLVWINKFSLTGSAESSSRLSYLLRFTIKWFGIMSVFLLIILLTSGYYFFDEVNNKNSGVDWKIPWIILSFNTSLTLVFSPILAFLEGLGRIKHVSQIRLYQQIVQLVLFVLFLFLGLRLFSGPLAAILSFCILPVGIFAGSEFQILKTIWNKIGVWRVSYRSEIFPYQWKIALSWISGYFIFQLFNPIIFATEGPEVAGKMGMTLAVLNAILSFSLSFMTTKVSVFSEMISKKQFVQLDFLFKKTLIQSTILNVLAVFFLFICIYYFSDYVIGDKKLGDRFLEMQSMIFMMIPIILNHLVGSWATYLRCHKKEPMLLQSIVIGILVLFSIVKLGQRYGVIGMTFGYMILSLVGFLWAYFIFVIKRKQWHEG